MQNELPLAAPGCAWAIGPEQTFSHTFGILNCITRRCPFIHTEHDTYIDRFMNRELISKWKNCDGRTDLCASGRGDGFMGSGDVDLRAVGGG
jgi:hypothetical protein